MKTIAFYSGKGGVGKSTVCGLTALGLANGGYEVAILDADINTPSMHVLFPNDKYKRLDVFSTGYKSSVTTYYSGVVGESVLMNMAKEIKKKEYDYILVDLPPSITSIHQNITKNFNFSSVIIVSQPTTLSQNDVKKTIPLFREINVPIMGIVYNMVGEHFLSVSKEYEGLKELLSIRLNKVLNHLIKKKVFHEIDTSFMTPLLNEINDLDEIFWKNTQGEFKLDPSSKEDIKELILNTKPSSKQRKEVLRFYNVETWDYIVDMLLEGEFFEDAFLEFNNSKKIKRVLDHFKEGDKAMFMITRPPSTEIHLFPGEIGVASLSLDQKTHYNIPRIKYFTDEGEVTLFPHEISPIGVEELQFFLENKEVILLPGTNVQRYIPSPSQMETIYNSFDLSGGSPPDWKTRYQKLGVLV